MKQEPCTRSALAMHRFRSMKTIILTSTLVLALAASATASADTTVTTNTKKTTTVKREEPVSTTRTTAAYYGPRDTAESTADQRRLIEGKHVTLAPMVGVASNDLGVGVGARMGYTFDTPIYLGGNVMYQAGNTGVSPVWYPSAEVGYDIGVSTLVVRPYGGAGALVRTQGSTSTGLLYPGVTVHWLIPRSAAFIGGDARVLFPMDTSAAFAMAFTTGLQL